MSDRHVGDRHLGDRGTLLLVLVVAFALRLLVAVASEPWTDELFFVATASGIPGELAAYLAATPSVIAGGFDASAVLATTPRLAGEAHPPLLLLAHSGIPLDSPAWLLRLPSLVLSLATLVLAIAWAHRRMGNPGAGQLVAAPQGALAIALLFGAAFPLVYHGAEARPYSGAIFFGLATTLLAIGPLRGQSWSAGLYVLYGLTCALGLYSHYYVGGLFPVQLLAAVLAMRGDPARRRHVVGVLLGLLLAALLFLPWAPVPWTKAHQFASAGQHANPSLVELLSGCVALVGGVARGWPLAVTVALSAGTLGLFVFAFRCWCRVAPSVAWQLVLAPLGVFALVLAAPSVHQFQPKHMCAAAGPLVLLLAGIWCDQKPWSRATKVLLGVVVSLQLLVCLVSVAVPREPWDRAWVVASSQLQPGDIVVFHPAHAKLGFHRPLARASRRLFPADDRLRTRADWGLAPLNLPRFRDGPEIAYWLHDDSQLGTEPQALHVWLFGPHAIAPPAELPQETLLGREGHIYLEIGPTEGR